MNGIFIQNIKPRCEERQREKEKDEPLLYITCGTLMKILVLKDVRCL